MTTEIMTDPGTGILLVPGFHGKGCPGNGSAAGMECCCDECDYLKCCTEEYEVREDKASTVNSFITTETNYFVSGEKNPADDTQWNEFLMTLKSIGREELMEVCQSAYDRQGK